MKISSFKTLSTFLLASGCLVYATQVAPEPLEQPPGVGDEPLLLQLSLGLEPENRELLDRTLFEITDPGSDRHGRYLGHDEAKALLHPSPESVEAIDRWLLQTGISDSNISHHGQFVRVAINSSQLKRLLGSNEINSSQAVVNLLPLSIRSHVSTIHTSNLRRKDAPHKPESNALSNSQIQCTRNYNDDRVDLETCKIKATPACLRKLYNIGDYFATSHGNDLLGIAGFNQQAAQYEDFGKFLRDFAPYAIGSNFSVELVNGGQNPQGQVPAGEANTDIQYAAAMSYNVPLRYYSTGGKMLDFIPDLDMPLHYGLPLETYLEFASYLLDLPDNDLPRVVAISYGANEQVVPKPYAQQVCSIFGQLATRGVSIIVASGDTGVGASCQSNDGTKTTRFLPIFPASCPYVTAVGSTESNGPEIASNFSSGGFSDYFDRPQWQDEAVKKYVAEHGDEWKGLYNHTGRAMPDLSAQGLHIPFWSHGESGETGGTSVSAPIFAGIVALLNDYRAKNNKPPMGFLNPWIYRVGNRAFTDITTGRSIGCTGHSMAELDSPKVPGAGWKAVPGWDPVTGWGTPLFDRLNELSNE